MTNKIPSYLCKECADKFEKKFETLGYGYSIHMGICPVCNEEKGLASAANYGLKYEPEFELRARVKKLEAKVETANIALRQIKNLNPELPDDKRAFDNGHSVFRIAEATLKNICRN